MPSSYSPARRLGRALAAFVTTIALVTSGAAAASAAPLEDEAPLSASISGTVSDAETGEGVADASVVILDADGATAGSTSTGSSGGYTVSELPAGDYRVSFSAAPSHEPIFWPAASAFDGADVVSLADGEVRVGVDAALSPAATEVAEAPVPAEDAAAADESSPGGDAGGLEAHAKVSAGTGDDNAVTSPATEEVVPTAVAATGTVRGTVTRESDGAPVAGVMVYAVSNTAASQSAPTGPDGAYEIAGIVPGVYRINFFDAALASEYWKDALDFSSATPVTVGAGETVVGIDASLEERQSSISGVVTRASDGSPVEGVSVSVSNHAGGYGSTLTASDGSYTFSGLARGAYRVQFMTSGRGLADEYWDGALSYEQAELITLGHAESKTGIDASLDAAGAVSGVVTRADTGAPLSGASVIVSQSGKSATTAADGSYTVHGVRPGDVYVWVSPPWGTSYLVQQFYPNTTSRDAAAPVAVGPGATTSGIDFALHEGIDIAGHVAFDGTPASLGANLVAYRWSGDAWAEQRRVTGLGDYTFTRNNHSALPLGTYTVGFEAAGYCSQFWDGVPSLDAATSFTPAVGTTQTGINATLTAACETPAVTAGAPTVSGMPQVGQTLTAAPGTWAPDPVELSYQWLANGQPIAGATGPTLALAAAQEGAQISVRVTGSRPGYTSTAATSPEVGPVASAPLPPVTPGTPAIDGTPTAGEVLTASPGTWDPADVTLSYQWSANGAPISGATGSTFVPGDAEVGASLTVTVTGSKSGHASASATSVPFGPIAAAPLLDLTTGTPTVSGTPRVGDTLTAEPGTWGPAPVTLSYQWLVDGAPVAGQTGATYRPGPDAAGKPVAVTVLGTKAGYNPASVASTSVGPVAEGDLETSVPVISGTPRVGEQLTVEPGDWGPAPVALTFQWLVNGTPVVDATGRTFQPTADDAGKTVTVAVTGTKPGYVSVTETSESTTVALGQLVVGDPRISGKAAVGQPLTADASDWGPAPLDIAYQWFADGEPIDGATSATYTPDPSVVGAEISVLVSASKPGYETAERTAAAGTVAPVVTVAPERAVRGAEIVIGGQYFLPGEEVDLVLHSDPLPLGTVIADDDGSFSTTIVVPENSAFGTHEIVATGSESGLVGSAPFEVYDPAAPPSGGNGSGSGAGAGSGSHGTPAGGLARTGSDLPLGGIAIGVMLLAAGGYLAARRRAVR